MAWDCVGRTERGAHRCWLRPVILNAASHRHSIALCLRRTPPHFSLAGFRLFCSVGRQEYFLLFFLINVPALWWSTERFPFITLAISPAVTWICDCWQVLNVSGLPVHFPVVHNFSCVDGSCLLYGSPCVYLTQELTADKLYLGQSRKAVSGSQILPKASYVFSFLWPVCMNHFP